MLRILTEVESEVTQLPYPFVSKDFAVVQFGEIVHIIKGEKHRTISVEESVMILDSLDDTSLDEFFD